MQRKHQLNNQKDLSRSTIYDLFPHLDWFCFLGIGYILNLHKLQSSASGYHDATNNYGNTNGVEIQNRHQTRINPFPYDVKSYLDPNFYAKHMQQQSMMRSPRNQASPISSTTATVGSVIPQQQHF